jgi:8-oxo-dGTP pyrophosphatase MutT (NUDIX family)
MNVRHGQVLRLCLTSWARLGRNWGGIVAFGEGELRVPVETASFMRQFHRYPAVDFGRYRRFVVADHHVGWVTPEFALVLAEFPDVFRLDDVAILLHDRFTGIEDRSRAVAGVLAALKARGQVPGWRDELYPVNRSFEEKPLLLLERAATPLFGLLSYGVNVNGLVRDGDSWKVWVARRSLTKQVDPGMLDIIVGGGLPYGLTVAENLLKECKEEAGIPPEIARNAKPCGLVTMAIPAAEGLRVGLQFNFDLELPADFTPNNTDGEVSEFQLWTLDRLEASLREADDFMFDVALVNLDLLVRLGRIGPEDPDYLDLIAKLRPTIPFVRT